MRRKFLVALMTMLMTVGLVGCGGDTPVNQFSATPETRPTESAVAESIPEESSEETKETEEPREEAKEESEEMADGNKVPGDEEISGLIIATLLTDIWSGSCEITSLDPDNGATKAIASFQYQSDSEVSYSFAISDKVFSGSYRFDESYAKMAAMKTINSNSEVHAGWLSSNGEFFDVTEAIGMASHSDFADPVKQLSIGFTDDGYFVFCDASKPLATKYYSVPLSDISPSTIIESYKMPYSACSATDDCFGAYDFPSDWIDATHCIVTLWDANPISSFVLDLETGTRAEYIPGSSRVNWNGRLSPDGTNIAFTSAPINGSESPDIFIIPIEGGEPTRVAEHGLTLTRIDDDFDLRNIPRNTRSCILIDWR